ncbi:PQQ-dependent sugar dehydrogenase [Fodinibius sp. Rm-B-1B1-1]|uniref:PQQ-dependent sugar dehydrogenase n=1 Tax=Fodinibius alkaliphilus TaxID=3140241 RepID=UPI00315AF51E
MYKYLSIFLVAILMTACNANTDTENEEDSVKQEYNTETIISEIDVPWGMDWLPNGDMLVTARSGDLWLYRNGSLVDESIGGVPEVWARGQGGLLDVNVHPNYEENGWIYITYSNSEGSGAGANTALMRAKLNNDRTELVDKEVLYKAEPNTERGQHFGSRIVFDNNGHVFFGIGDRGARNVNPQDISRDAGKIYRLNEDGSIPEDNPFVGEDGAKEAIFAYGNRNPQGMDLHPETGQLWEHEHGPRGGDEINIIEAGNNYGWPEICFCIDYDGTEITPDTAKAGMEQPEWYWDPSIAPSGMTFVTGDKFPEWQGDILVGSLKFGYVMHVDVENGEVVGEEKVFEDIGRVRNVKQGPDGNIYVATETDSGVVRISPANE